MFTHGGMALLVEGKGVSKETAYIDAYNRARDLARENALPWTSS
jgi:hypothetical protein